MTTITMIYYNTEKKSTIPWGKLIRFFKKLHTVTVTPQQDNHFRKQIVYLKLSLCILVKDKVSTPHIVVITAHCHKGYILLTGISMVWWIKRALQEYCLLLFFFVLFVIFLLLFFSLIIVTTRLPRWISGPPSDSCSNCFVIQLRKIMSKYTGCEVPPASNDRRMRKSQNNPNRWSNMCIAIFYSENITLVYFT